MVWFTRKEDKQSSYPPILLTAVDCALFELYLTTEWHKIFFWKIPWGTLPQTVLLLHSIQSLQALLLDYCLHILLNKEFKLSYLSMPNQMTKWLSKFNFHAAGIGQQPAGALNHIFIFSSWLNHTIQLLQWQCLSGNQC